MAQKVIIIDWGILTHKAIFAWPNNKAVPPTYTGMSMAIGWLSRIDLDPDDLILVAVDSRNVWRKDFEVAYKGNRKEKRENSGIDFPKFYEEFNVLHERLNKGLNWHFIKLDRLEADDIMAVACRYYHDKEVILVTHDADLQQMWEYPNVKIFSTYTKKWKIKPKNFDLTRLQAEKIYKEVTDNMVSEILNEEDYEIRRKCIDLISLPDFVESAVIEALKKVGPKDCDINAIPFQSLHERFAKLYNDKSKVLSYESQVAKEEKEIEREKRKKTEAKEKVKRAKEKELNKIAKEKEKQQKLDARIKKLEKKQVDKIKLDLKLQKEKENVEIHQSSYSNEHVEIKG